MAIDMLKLVVVCWNHIDGDVAVWWVSPYYEPLLDNSLHMALTPACRRWCSEFVANVYALKANSFVLLDRPAGLFHGGLVGGHSKESVGRVSQSA